MHSFMEANRGGSENWEALVTHVSKAGIKPWLAESLDAAGSVIAGALNVLGIRNVVVTGSLTEMPTAVMDRLTSSIREGAMWGRFGTITCESAPRRRLAGLAAYGIDRLLVPIEGQRNLKKALQL